MNRCHRALIATLAIPILAALAAQEPIAALIKGLENPNAGARATAAMSLAKLGPAAKPAVPALGIALADRDLNVRYWAASALKAIGPAAQAAVPALVNALNTFPGGSPPLDGPARYYPDIRSVAAEALGAIGRGASGAIAALKKALNDPDPSVRAAAADALKRITPSYIANSATSRAGRPGLGGIRAVGAGTRVASVTGCRDDGIVVVPCGGGQMNGEALSRIEDKLDAVQTDVAQLRAEVGGLRIGQAELWAGQADLRTGQADLRTGQADLRTGQADLRTGQADLRTGVQDLRRHMDVLHEDLLDRIKGATLDPQLVDDKIERGDNAVRAEVNERIAPIESAIRTWGRP